MLERARRNSHDNPTRNATFETGHPRGAFSGYM